MSWQPDPNTINADGEYSLMWVDDGEGSKDTTGSQPTPTTPDQHNAAVVDGNDVSPGETVATNTPTTEPTDPSSPSGMAAVAKSLGLTNADGSINWGKVLGAGGAALGVIDAATKQPQTVKSIAELRAGMPTMNTPAFWTPEQLAIGTRPMQTGTALQRVYAADMPSPIVPGTTTKKFADGGPVGALGQAFAGAVMGSAGGQSDLVDAKLSPGEYVMDADSVSALGDGNTAAGIAKLDELRRQLRAEKRGAPDSAIPPQAKGPLSYMQGAQ